MEIGKSVYDWLVSAQRDGKIDLGELESEVVTKEVVSAYQW